MLRGNLRQTIVVLVFVAGLVVGSAQPAAAQGLGWREAWDWVSSLWGGATLFQPVSSIDSVHGEEEPPATPNGECGPEIDPNGCPRTQTSSAGSPSGI